MVDDEFIRAVAEATGVLPAMIGGSTPAEVWRSASDAVEWRRSTGPEPPAKPPTAAVSASTVRYTSSGSPLDGRIVGPQQITTRDQLSRLSPAERMRAYRQGRLSQLGASRSPRCCRSWLNATTRRDVTEITARRGGFSRPLPAAPPAPSGLNRGVATPRYEG